MELFLAILALGVLGLIALFIYVRRNNEADEKREREEEIEKLRKVVDNSFGEARKRPVPTPPPMRSVGPGVRPKSPPPAPKVRSFRDERPVAPVSNIADSNSGISATDVLLAALVVDALTDDTPTKCEPTFEPGGGSFGGGGASSSWDSDSSSSSSSRDYSDYSGSSSSYDSGSSSSSDSSSSSYSD